MAEAQNGEGGPGVLGRLLMARDQARVDQGGATALPRAQPVTATRAATQAMARAFEGLCGLPASTLDLTPAAITLAEMAELLPRPALLSVVEGAGEAIGVVAICPTLMTALIEVQTLGRITARPVEARRPTRSDAMICADFVNALLAELGDGMTRIDGFEGFGGFRYAGFTDDQRPLLLMLDDSPYRSLRFRLRLGQSPGREGDIFLALPQQHATAALPAAKDEHKPGPGPLAGQGKSGVIGTMALKTSGDPQLALRIQDAPIDVVGVLCRRRLRLGLLRSLEPGQILPLPRVDLAETRLETGRGQLLAIGKLGEAEGCHAIRLRGAREAAGKPAATTPEGSARMAGARGTSGSAADGGGDGRRGTPAQVEPPIADLDHPDRFRLPAEGADGKGVSAPPPHKTALSG